MDQAEARTGRVRRLRRLSRRKVVVFGAPWSWGDGFNLCLGHGSARDGRFPEAIGKLRTKGIVQISVGGAHCAALSSGGRVYTWGVGLYGRLGHGDMGDRSNPTLMTVSKDEKTMVVQVVPTRVLRSLDAVMIANVACGDHFTIAVTAAGTSYSWGRGRYGSLGQGDLADRLDPTPVEALRRVLVVKLACGLNHALALRDDGVLYGWGRGKGGAHGHGHTHDAALPGEVVGLGGRLVVDMAGGRRHSALLTVKGEVFTWGSGEGFALGTTSEATQLLPARVHAVRKFVIVGIAAGGNRTAALARGGDLYIWGGLLSAVSDPELFREAAHRFGTVEVPEEGGVRDAEMPVGLMERTAAHFPSKPPELFAGAQTDIAPPHILRAALSARIPPHTILNVRYELLESARVAALRFALPPKIAEQVPLANSSWAKHGLAPLAGAKGGVMAASLEAAPLHSAQGGPEYESLTGYPDGDEDATGVHVKMAPWVGPEIPDVRALPEGVGGQHCSKREKRRDDSAEWVGVGGGRAGGVGGGGEHVVIARKRTARPRLLILSSQISLVEMSVLVRKRRARPRLLRVLRSEIVLVAMGDGVTIVGCNKEEAGKGTMAAKGLHVSSKLRHQVRAMERKMISEVKKERKMLLAREAADVARRARDVGAAEKGAQNVGAVDITGTPRSVASGEKGGGHTPGAPSTSTSAAPNAPEGSADVSSSFAGAAGGASSGASGVASTGPAGVSSSSTGAAGVDIAGAAGVAGAADVTGGAERRRRIAVGGLVGPGLGEEGGEVDEAAGVGSSTASRDGGSGLASRDGGSASRAGSGGPSTAEG
ncbi:regulator of chromosome condensation 1/beta-lactamase-inhibitor protein II, partial [Baffinella frigidus]